MIYNTCQQLLDLLSYHATSIISYNFTSVYSRYTEKNVRDSPGYSKPDQTVPNFLHCMQGWVRKHVLPRYYSGLSRNDVQEITRGYFTVNSESHETGYTIYLGSNEEDPSCTCPDWKSNHLPCKHLCTILRCVPGISWESLLLAMQDQVPFAETGWSRPRVSTGRVQCTWWWFGEPGLFWLTVGDITNLLGIKRSKTHRLISTCIEKLKTLQGHVYNLKDDKFLQHLILQIDILKDAVHLQVPKEAGLTVLDSN